MTEYEPGNRRVKIVVDGEKISAIRRDLGLSQGELAKRSKVSLSTITRIEQNGEVGTPVYGTTWRKLARALKLRPGSSADSIRIFDAYTFKGYNADGVYVRDPLSLDERYDRMKAAEQER